MNVYVTILNVTIHQCCSHPISLQPHCGIHFQDQVLVTNFFLKYQPILG